MEQVILIEGKVADSDKAKSPTPTETFTQQKEVN